MKEKIYLIGIGGIAMSNLACLLKKMGSLVSGSDLDTFGPSAELLKKHDIQYFKDHNARHIKKFKPDMVVIGNAIQRGNPALEYVLNEQIPYCSMPELIKTKLLGNTTSTHSTNAQGGEQSRTTKFSSRKPIVVAGTSGKTTTTAILSWILKSAGLKPSALVGGIMKNTDSGFMAGNGEYFVIEGDEYNSCFYDSCPKFLHYLPYHAIITNIQPDHLDIYGSMENIYKAFQKLAKIVPENGSLILNNSDRHTADLTKSSKSKTTTFGKNGDIWASSAKATPDGLSFVVYSGSKRLGEIKSRLLGQHNSENILAAIAVAIELKIPFKKITQAVASFQGVKRRLEIIYPVRSRGTLRTLAASNGVYQKDNTIIIDDFAHNPDKVLASLSALRKHFPKHQLVAMFEPRTGSSRRKFFQDAYISSFKPADLVYIAEPYKKSALDKKEAFSSHRLAKDLNKNGIEAYAMKDAGQIISYLKKSLSRIHQKPTIIAVMSSGEFEGIHRKLIELVG